MSTYIEDPREWLEDALCWRDHAADWLKFRAAQCANPDTVQDMQHVYDTWARWIQEFLIKHPELRPDGEQ